MNPAFLIGDPNGMRRLAGELAARAAAIRRDADTADRAVGDMRFQAPAAHRLRGSVHHEVAQLRAVAAEVEALAHTVRVGADQVAQAQAEAKRIAAEKARRAAEEARRASDAARHAGDAAVQALRGRR
jgi:hypothetical protein